MIFKKKKFKISGAMLHRGSTTDIDFITSLKTHQQWKKTQKKEWSDVNLCIFCTL